MSVRNATPYLLFNGHAREAIALYEAALGAQIESISRFGDVDQSCPEARRDLVMHAALRVDGALLMLSDGPFDQPLPPTGIENADDLKEFDQLFALHPMQASAGSTPFREFLPVSSGIILGTINNFQPTITIDNGNGEFDEINIDVYFEIEGTYFFNDFGFGPVAPFADQDAQFEENEAINPDHRFMMVVPAGDIILRTIVLDTDGSVSSRFQPTETEITIGPGGVREVSLNINQSQDTLNAGSGGGGGAA